MRAFLIAAAALAALPALAQDRPSEEAIFGAPAEVPTGKEAPAQPSSRPSEDALFGGGGVPAEKPSAQPAAVKPAQPSNRPSEDAMFGDGGAPAEKPSAQPAAVKPPPSTTELAEEKREMAPDDPLRIGGQFYWRAYSVASERIPPSGWTFSAPTLLDAYFDARPNERVRGFALGRLTYDPTINNESASTTSLMAANQQQLNAVLDQLWLRFDLGRTAFITAGRQHVKWGVGRFWNPTDYLHQVYRDPLTQFDARVGTTMVKLHVPWERTGWNFYGIGLLEDTVPGGSLGKIGAGARAEVVLGSAEFGIDALVQRGHRPRLGADFSAGLGPVDVYGEVALRKGAGTLQDHLVEIDGNPVGCEETTLEGDTVQATGGANYAFNFTDEFVLTAGAEYFFNSAGATRADDYPCMMVKRHFTPFYVGKHYLGLFASWMNPSRRTAPVVTLSNLSNLSDLSHVARLDYWMMLLTHLRVEAYTAYHYGNRGGEFRLGIDYPSRPLPDGSSTPAIFWPYPAVEFGLGLRISL
jgi:hypothetical protein